MNVNEGFDELQCAVDATREAVTEARRRRDVFRTALGRAEDVLDVFSSGSLARSTHKDPIHDVDVVAVFDVDAHPQWGDPGNSALNALEYTRELVKETLGSNGTEAEEVRLTRVLNHAVKCFLDDPDVEGAFTVDVATALWHPDRGIWIPERDSRLWVRSDPKHLIRLVAERRAAWSRFPELVRVLKRWNTDHGHTMKSLVVEVLALAHLPVADRPQAVARFFAAAQEAVWSPVCDPAGLCGEIQPDLDRGAASKVLADAADEAARALEATARGENRRAMCLWRKIFGEIYPEPYLGCNESGLVVPPVPKRKIVDAPQG